MSAKQRCIHRSKTCCQTLKHFENVFSTCCENVVEVLLLYVRADKAGWNVPDG